MPLFEADVLDRDSNPGNLAGARIASESALVGRQSMCDHAPLPFPLRRFEGSVELIIPRHSLDRAIKMAIAFALCTAAAIAQAQVYKCTDASGKTTYSDTACDAAARPLKLPEDPKANTTNPRVCEQLLDETRRLAADADRNAKRGVRESTGSAKRRAALTRQYEARCVGIARSEPKRK